MTEDRIPPANVEAEQCVLGSMLLDNGATAQIKGCLVPEDFYSTAHRVLYRACIELWEEHGAFDLMIVHERLERDGDLELLGGLEYLTRVLESVPSPANAGHYARIVKEKSTARQLLCLGSALDRLVAGGRVDVDAVSGVLADMQRTVAAGQGGRVRSVFEVVQEIVKQQDEPEADILPTGLIDVDRIIQGFRAPNLIVLASRPSVGKTSFVTTVMDRIGATRPALLFSLEMANTEVVLNILAARMSTNRTALRGRWTEEVWGKAAKTLGELDGHRLLIDDSPALSAAQIGATVDRLHKIEPLSLVAVDYLGLVGTKGVDETRELGDVCAQLKAVAKRNHIPVVLLSQLNRYSEREGREPGKADLRGSGKIEEHADVILFLHDPMKSAKTKQQREAVKSAGRAGLVKLIVSKQRTGPTGACWLHFDAEHLRFGNAARAEFDE